VPPSAGAMATRIEAWCLTCRRRMPLIEVFDLEDAAAPPPPLPGAASRLQGLRLRRHGSWRTSRLARAPCRSGSARRKPRPASQSGRRSLSQRCPGGSAAEFGLLVESPSSLSQRGHGGDEHYAPRQRDTEGADLDGLEHGAPPLAGTASAGREDSRGGMASRIQTQGVAGADTCSRHDISGG